MKIDQRSPLLEGGRELRRISGPAEPKSAAIGMEGQRAEITAYQAPIDLDPSPAFSLVGKAKPTLKGRKVGALVTDGADGDLLESLGAALDKEGAELAIVAPRSVELILNQESLWWPTWRCQARRRFSLMLWRSSPPRRGSSRFSRAALRSTGFEMLSTTLRLLATAQRRTPLFAKASIADDLDEGVIELDDRPGVRQYIEAAKQQRVWAREARLAESDA